MTKDESYEARLRAELETILTDGEKILDVSTQQAIKSPLKRDSALITNRRLIIYKPRMLGRMFMQDFLWQDIRDVRITDKLLGATLTVYTHQSPDHATATIEGLEKLSARRLYSRAQEIEEQWREKHRIRRMEEERARAGGVYLDGSGAAAGRPAPKGSIEERLQKLKALHEQGLITDAEFEARKTQIIAEL